TPDVSTLSLHDALPISGCCSAQSTPLRSNGPLPIPSARAGRTALLSFVPAARFLSASPRRSGARRSPCIECPVQRSPGGRTASRSEEHTSELQSLAYLV